MFVQNNDNNAMEYAVKKKKSLRKITPQSLKNIALYYLQRFETTQQNLRLVLRRRVDAYVHENPQFSKKDAYDWIENVLAEFEKLHYLDDARYAEMKINSYLNAGKPARYIYNKLREKGVEENIINELLQEADYNPLDMALNFIKRKKIGAYRTEEQQKLCRTKDLAALLRAGFDYDVAVQALDSSIEELEF